MTSLEQPCALFLPGNTADDVLSPVWALRLVAGDPPFLRSILTTLPPSLLQAAATSIGAGVILTPHAPSGVHRCLLAEVKVALEAVGLDLQPLRVLGLDQLADPTSPPPAASCASFAAFSASLDVVLPAPCPRLQGVSPSSAAPAAASAMISAASKPELPEPTAGTPAGQYVAMEGVPLPLTWWPLWAMHPHLLHLALPSLTVEDCEKPQAGLLWWHGHGLLHHGLARCLEAGAVTPSTLWHGVSSLLVACEALQSAVGTGGASPTAADEQQLTGDSATAAAGVASAMLQPLLGCVALGSVEESSPAAVREALEAAGVPGDAAELWGSLSRLGTSAGTAATPPAFIANPPQAPSEAAPTSGGGASASTVEAVGGAVQDAVTDAASDLTAAAKAALYTAATAQRQWCRAMLQDLTMLEWAGHAQEHFPHVWEGPLRPELAGLPWAPGFRGGAGAVAEAVQRAATAHTCTSAASPAEAVQVALALGRTGFPLADAMTRALATGAALPPAAAPQGLNAELPDAPPTTSMPETLRAVQEGLQAHPLALPPPLVSLAHHVSVRCLTGFLAQYARLPWGMALASLAALSPELGWLLCAPSSGPGLLLAVQWAVGFVPDPTSPAPHPHGAIVPSSTFAAASLDASGAFTAAWLPQVSALFPDAGAATPPGVVPALLRPWQIPAAATQLAASPFAQAFGAGQAPRGGPAPASGKGSGGWGWFGKKGGSAEATAAAPPPTFPLALPTPPFETYCLPMLDVAQARKALIKAVGGVSDAARGGLVKAAAALGSDTSPSAHTLDIPLPAPGPLPRQAAHGVPVAPGPAPLAVTGQNTGEAPFQQAMQEGQHPEPEDGDALPPAWLGTAGSVGGQPVASAAVAQSMRASLALWGGQGGSWDVPPAGLGRWAGPSMAVPTQHAAAAGGSTHSPTPAQALAQLEASKAKAKAAWFGGTDEAAAAGEGEPFHVVSQQAVAACFPSPAAATSAHAMLQNRGYLPLVGCDVAWGRLEGNLLLTEEDAWVLLGMDVEDPTTVGMSQVLANADLQLKVYMAEVGSTGLKMVLGRSTIPDLAAEDAVAAIARLSQYKRWDLTWMHVRRLCRLDAFNEALYFLADTPPPPMNAIVAQRDFVMLRHVLTDPIAGAHCIAFRNGAHAAVPEVKPNIRGFTLGVVGFIVKDLGPGKGCSVTFTTGANMKGSIPAMLVNFVAKRTPVMWITRLKEAVQRFKAEQGEAAAAAGSG